MVDIILQGVRLRLERERNERVSQAWMTAALTRTQRLPRLDTLLVRTERPRAQTWQQQLAVVKMIHAAFGGA